MMRDLLRPFVRTLAAATFLGSIGFVGLSPAVSWAQGAVSGPSGTAAPAADTGAPMPENGVRPPLTHWRSASITCTGSCVSRQRRSRFGPVSRK
jgi:hypothetical protein